MTQSLALLFLAGGNGSRMNTSLPKTFLPLGGKRVFAHSLERLLSLDLFDQIAIVASPEYRPLFPNNLDNVWALPGERRQDSVANALEALPSPTTHLLVHDAARPFIDPESVLALIEAGFTTGAAALGIPLPFTIKECSPDGKVVQTPSRDRYWEIQTPQMIRTDWLRDGLKKAHREGVTLTDDVSAAEFLGHPVQLIEGTRANQKLTYPEDFAYAEWSIQKI